MFVSRRKYSELVNNEKSYRELCDVLTREISHAIIQIESLREENTELRKDYAELQMNGVSKDKHLELLNELALTRSSFEREKQQNRTDESNLKDFISRQASMIDWLINR